MKEQFLPVPQVFTKDVLKALKKTQVVFHTNMSQKKKKKKNPHRIRSHFRGEARLLTLVIDPFKQFLSSKTFGLTAGKTVLRHITSHNGSKLVKTF